MQLYMTLTVSEVQAQAIGRALGVGYDHIQRECERIAQAAAQKALDEKGKAAVASTTKAKAKS